MKYIFLLFALIVLPARGQKMWSSTWNVDMTAYHALGTTPFERYSAATVTMAVSPALGVRLSAASSEKSRIDGQRRSFVTLGTSVLPQQAGRFRLVPSMGAGVAYGKDEMKRNRAYFCFETNLSAQYYVSSGFYCGVDLRYIIARKKEFLAAHLLGLNLGYSF